MGQSDLSVAVVVPTLNEATSIPSLLSNIRAAISRAPSGMSIHLVVVDGGSRDDTISLARKAHATVLQVAAGRASQMSAGVRHRRTDVVVFLHADSRIEQGYFLQLSAALNAGAQWGFSQLKLDSRAWWAVGLSALINARSRLTGICTGDQTFYSRTSLYQAVGGMPMVALMEDVLLASRLNCLAAPTVLTQAVTTSARRWQKNGVLKTIVLMHFLRLMHYFGVRGDLLQRWYDGR